MSTNQPTNIPPQDTTTQTLLNLKIASFKYGCYLYGLDQRSGRNLTDIIEAQEGQWEPVLEKITIDRIGRVNAISLSIEYSDLKKIGYQGVVYKGWFSDMKFGKANLRSNNEPIFYNMDNKPFIIHQKFGNNKI